MAVSIRQRQEDLEPTERTCIWLCLATILIPAYAYQSQVSVVGGQRVFEKRIKRKTLEILYELGLYDSEAPIILHGIVSRGDFSQVQIVVSNTGTEDFALVDMGKLTFTVEQFHSMPKRGGPYNMTMLQNYYLHAITMSPSGTSDEEDSHYGDSLLESISSSPP
jgi:hypothetical protein